MRNGIEAVRNPRAFMKRMRLMILDSQTKQQLEKAKRGEIDYYSDRYGHLAIHNGLHLLTEIDRLLTATSEDINKRKKFELERYRELLAKGKLTPQMRKYGERKGIRELVKL